MNGVCGAHVVGWFVDLPRFAPRWYACDHWIDSYFLGRWHKDQKELQKKIAHTKLKVET